MDLLSELATKYGTDKGPKHHNYTPIYDKIMNPTRMSVSAVLEIGLQYGSSAKMWLDYFPNATVYSVDNDVTCIRALTNSDFPGRDRWIGMFADQQNESLWRNPLPQFDYVIDDGSHKPEDMVITLENGFKFMKPGGLWIIEDGHCAFHENFNKHLPDNIVYDYIFQRIIAQQKMGVMSGNFYIERGRDQDKHLLAGMIYSFHFYKSLIILERAMEA